MPENKLPNSYKPVNSDTPKKIWLYVVWGTTPENAEYGIAKTTDGENWYKKLNNPFVSSIPCSEPLGWVREYETPKLS